MFQIFCGPVSCVCDPYTFFCNDISPFTPSCFLLPFLGCMFLIYFLETQSLIDYVYNSSPLEGTRSLEGSLIRRNSLPATRMFQSRILAKYFSMESLLLLWLLPYLTMDILPIPCDGQRGSFWIFAMRTLPPSVVSW